MVLGVRLGPGGQDWGSGLSWADASPSGVGVDEVWAVPIGMGVVEAFTVGGCPACGDDVAVQAVRTRMSPVSRISRESYLMFIFLAPAAAIRSGSHATFLVAHLKLFSIIYMCLLFS
jgi:hypothetical protein